MNLLSKLKQHVTLRTLITIYKTMVIPLITYSGTTNLMFTRTQLQKFHSIENRVNSIIGSVNHEICMPQISNLKKANMYYCQKVVDERNVFKFRKLFHLKQKHNKNCFLKLPKVRLEYARKSFFYAGAKTYNELPIEIRREENYSKFKNILKLHFT